MKFRQQILNSSKYTATIFVALLLSVAMFSSVALHSPTVRNDKTSSNCESMCLSHGQSAATSNLVDNIEEDDKEPKPPSTLLDSPRVISIGLYGVAYSLIIALIYHNRRYLLIQQLRF